MVSASGRLSTCHLQFFLKKFQHVACSRHLQLLSLSFGKFSGLLAAKQFSYKGLHMPSVGFQYGDRTRWVFNPTILKKKKLCSYRDLNQGTYHSMQVHSWAVLDINFERDTLLQVLPGFHRARLNWQRTARRAAQVPWSTHHLVTVTSRPTRVYGEKSHHMARFLTI